MTVTWTLDPKNLTLTILPYLQPTSLDWLTDWFYWTLLQPLKGWIAKYDMYVNTTIQNTNNRKYNTKKNIHNVTKIQAYTEINVIRIKEENRVWLVGRDCNCLKDIVGLYSVYLLIAIRHTTFGDISILFSHTSTAAIQNNIQNLCVIGDVLSEI